MDLKTMLEEEHAAAAALMEKIENASAEAENTRQGLFGELKNDLLLHIWIEENHLYPELQRYSETTELANQAIEEHRVVKILLDELDDLWTNAEEWSARFKVLKESVERHVTFEEKTLLPQGTTIMGEQRAFEIAGKMITEKAEKKAFQ